MPKYSAKTYGRSRVREIKSSAEFDKLQNSDSLTLNVTSEANFTRSFQRKSPWARTNRTVNSNANLFKESTLDLLRTKKRRKLEVIEEKDPFAFDESDVTALSDAQKGFLRNTTERRAQRSFTDFTDKSTDDEAYSSESSSQGSDKIKKPSDNCLKGRLTTVRGLSTFFEVNTITTVFSWLV